MSLLTIVPGMQQRSYTSHVHAELAFLAIRLQSSTSCPNMAIEQSHDCSPAFCWITNTIIRTPIWSWARILQDLRYFWFTIFVVYSLFLLGGTKELRLVYLMESTIYLCVYKSPLPLSMLHLPRLSTVGADASRCVSHHPLLSPALYAP